jgi:hypothetical protein
VSEMFAETEALAADLALAPARLKVALTAVVSKGALNIKNDWRANASGLPHAPAYPSSITYDLTPAPGRIEAEIGPDKNKRQGALGNLIEFGSSKNPPHLDGARALAAEMPRFVDACAEAAQKSVLG